MVAQRMFASPIRSPVSAWPNCSACAPATWLTPRSPACRYVLFDLARQTDLHPADLVPELEPLLALHRLPADDPEPAAGTGDVHHDVHAIRQIWPVCCATRSHSVTDSFDLRTDERDP